MATWPTFAPYITLVDNLVSEVLSLKIEGRLLLFSTWRGLFSRSCVRFFLIALVDIGNRMIISTVFCIPELLNLFKEHLSAEWPGVKFSHFSWHRVAKRTTRKVSRALSMNKTPKKAGLLRRTTSRYLACFIPNLSNRFAQKFFSQTGPTVLKNRLSRCTFHSAKISVSDEWNAKETLASIEHFCWFYPSWNYLADVLAFSLIAQLHLRRNLFSGS